MIAATKVKEGLLRGDAVLWRLSERINFDEGGRTEYVVTSRINLDPARETLMFPADADGNVMDWGELPGSIVGYADHEEVIANAGWVVA